MPVRGSALLGSALLPIQTSVLWWLQYATFIVLVMDHYNNGSPAGVIFAEREDAATLSPALAALVRVIDPIKPGFRPSCWIVDDDTAEHNAIW